MERPQRIQLRRTKGWKMPPNTVKVDRTTKFGNPFIVGEGYTRVGSVATFRRFLAGKLGSRQVPYLPDRRAAILKGLSELAGKNLACWCKPGELCHADVLLELANAPPQPNAGDRG